MADDSNTISVRLKAIIDCGGSHAAIFETQTKGWMLADNPTLEGIPIRPEISHPRALDSDGNPRYDIFNVFFAKKAQLDHLVIEDDYALTVAPIQS